MFILVLWHFFRMKGIKMLTESKLVRSFKDIKTLEYFDKTVITLFSGGLDSSYLLSVLKSMKFRRIIALSVDLGEDAEKYQMSKTAQVFGAELKFIDARDEFVKNSVLPAIKSQAKYLGIYPVSSTLSRPVIAKIAVELANLENVEIILHTANQSQNSLRRLNGAIESLGFKGYFGSPYEYSAITRNEKAEALSSYGLEFYLERKLSMDANLWCREFESGSLDNPENFVLDERFYKWSIKPEANYKDEIAITFERGIPVAIDGVQKTPRSLIENLNIRAGKAGIGRYAGLEHLPGQEKVLEVREMPAACLLLDAYRHLETAILPSTLIVNKLHLEQIWVQEAVEGRWFSKLKNASYAFIESVSESISGTVVYTLGCQSFFPKSIMANTPLYLTERDVWEVQKAIQTSRRGIMSINEFSELKTLQKEIV